eukprot:1563224-Pyramimonas_sp.AAC.2
MGNSGKRSYMVNRTTKPGTAAHESTHVRLALIDTRAIGIDAGGYPLQFVLSYKCSPLSPTSTRER